MMLTSCSSLLQMAQKPDDQAITSEVQAKLFADVVLKTRDIRVSSSSGVVALAGSVSTELEKAAAENLAKQVKGVKQVTNELIVSPMAGAPTAAPVETAAAATPAPEAESAPVEQPKPQRKVRRAESAPAASKASKPSARAESAAAPAEAGPAAQAASTPAPEVSAPAAVTPGPAPVRQAEQITIPAGSTITVRMIDGIDSSQHRAGEEFAATVDAPVVVDDRVIIRRGADARVRLRQAVSSGRMTGRSELEVELVGLAVGSQTYAVETSVVEKAGASRGKRTAATVGGGAALGGLIGAIAGKGKGAAIGAAIGAGAGTAVQASTKGEQVQIPPETKLDFTLKAPLTVTM
ncbi:MAG: BON domain-containing protein, partial [Burkholderiales bacterium]